MRRTLAATVTASVALALSGTATVPTALAAGVPGATGVAASRPSTPTRPKPAPAHQNGFQQVGHDGLGARGMNAALAVFDHYVYVGSRTDASAGHPNPGVIIVDARQPRHLRTVGQIKGPFEAQPYLTSRELRVIPDQKLLVVLNFKCSSVIHACAKPPVGTTVASNFTFYDISRPAHPRYVSTYTPSEKPHEFFLWHDPHRAGRTLMYYTTPTNSISPTENDATPANLVVTDVSKAKSGVFTDLARYNPNIRIAPFLRSADEDDALHSLSLRYDGKRAYLAYLGSGMLVLDTREIAAGKAHPQLKLVTDPAKRPSWGNPGDHSEVKVPGRKYTLSTTEVYGTFTGPDQHCPWGWVRMIDIHNETAPKVVGTFKTTHNDPSKCAGYSANTLDRSSYASHNPTLIGDDLALVTWHSDGLQAIDISNPTRPSSAGAFLPTPLAKVATEDPALGGGDSHVQAWSYPVVSDGLIYMVDIRNGLYVLRYHGAHGNPLKKIHLLEGNDNFGDAARFGN